MGWTASATSIRDRAARCRPGPRHWTRSSDDQAPSRRTSSGSGKQVDIQGIIATEGDADRRVAYLTKYLAKSFAETFADEDELTRRQRVHLRRLHEEVRLAAVLVAVLELAAVRRAARGRAAGMVPGSCPAKAHDA